MLFRVDAGGPVGLGHFYRSVNLARELRKKGHFIEFIHRKSSFWDEQKNFEFVHRDIRLENENQEILDILKKGVFDIFFVDGIINFQEDGFREIKELVKVVFYQNLSSSKYLADVYILPSIHQGSDFFEGFDNHTKIFQGLEYFTFNEKVASINIKRPDELKKVKSVGIATGGSDPENVLLSLYNIIDHKNYAPIQFVYFKGANYLHSNTLPINPPPNVSFQMYDPKKINQADLLVSTFGVSTYEFMYLGMPTLSLGHQASNTFASKVLAERTRSIFHLGDIHEINPIELNKNLNAFIYDDSRRIELSKNARGLVDLKGISRVVNILENEG
jgi:spore coat polysaccharide biosynthesis predicted glycosyltransferase SpsG